MPEYRPAMFPARDRPGEILYLTEQYVPAVTTCQQPQVKNVVQLHTDRRKG